MIKSDKTHFRYLFLKEPSSLTENYTFSESGNTVYWFESSGVTVNVACKNFINVLTSMADVAK